MLGRLATLFFFSSRRRHTRLTCDWSSDVCSSDLWQMTRPWAVHLHIKDWVKGEERGRLAGTGQGRIAEVLDDAMKAEYDGFVTMEPHLLGGGPTGGQTGPELFPKAATALRKIL